jgi:vitellogenic carboxypeptidase-like protein
MASAGRTTARVVCLILGFQIAGLLAYSDFPTKEEPFDGYDLDTSETLILTPLIKSDQLESAREAAKVKPLMRKEESYSGFLTVEEQFESNLFFWFFPRARSSNWTKERTVVWLQGAPGISSLHGLFTENGPYVPHRQNVASRRYSWNKYFNVLYLDSTIGSGYSFTKSKRGYSKNIFDLSNNVFEALGQFYKLFPELQKNGLILAGDTYAGRHIPLIAYMLTNFQSNITFDRMFIGNPFLSLGLHGSHGSHLYNAGLVGQAGREIFQNHEKTLKLLIQSGAISKAAEQFEKLFFYNEGKSPVYRSLTRLDQHHDYTGPLGNKSVKFEELIQTEDMKKRLHIGKINWKKNGNVYNALKTDIMRPAEKLFAYTLKTIDAPVLLYVGQLSILNPHINVESFLSKLKWKGTIDYVDSKRHLLIWTHSKDVIGYFKTTKGITNVVVRGIGEVVPQHKEKYVLGILRNFADNYFRDFEEQDLEG